jgi:hypothetical protein
LLALGVRAVGLGREESGGGRGVKKMIGILPRLVGEAMGVSSFVSGPMSVVKDWLILDV